MLSKAIEFKDKHLWKWNLGQKWWKECFWKSAGFEVINRQCFQHDLLVKKKRKKAKLYSEIKNNTEKYKLLIPLYISNILTKIFFYINNIEKKNLLAAKEDVYKLEMFSEDVK